MCSVDGFNDIANFNFIFTCHFLEKEKKEEEIQDLDQLLRMERLKEKETKDEVEPTEGEDETQVIV